MDGLCCNSFRPRSRFGKMSGEAQIRVGKFGDRTAKKSANFHQEFQVPKMEVLNLIRLFWGWGFPYISLTYSLYRWVPEMFGEICWTTKMEKYLNIWMNEISMSFGGSALWDFGDCWGGNIDTMKSHQLGSFQYGSFKSQESRYFMRSVLYYERDVKLLRLDFQDIYKTFYYMSPKLKSSKTRLPENFKIFNHYLSPHWNFHVRKWTEKEPKARLKSIDGWKEIWRSSSGCL